jgi:hypothetical protein
MITYTVCYYLHVGIRVQIQHNITEDETVPYVLIWDCFRNHLK